jgi:glutamate-1-semialdehyde 2,1-aminomutase
MRRNLTMDAALEEAVQRYTSANPKSEQSFQDAKRGLPGGNTRTGLYYAPFPLTLAGGEGARVRDVDGHDYTDFVVELTAGLYGHSNPALQAAIKNAINSGIVLGGHNTVEGKLAEAVCARIPSIEKVRFCNSGSEATLYTLSALRLGSGRDKVMAFEGSYHGGFLNFANAGPSLNVPFPFIMGRYNDSEGAAALIEANAADLAAVIVEPMVGAAGCIPATGEFLQALRDATKRHGVALVFDEVMTSRLAPGGLQEHHGITPDMTTLGKYLGGGLPFGAFGGSEELMARFDPTHSNVFQQSGTFNNNILTMSAGLAGLTEVFTPDACRALNAAGDALRDRLNGIFQSRGVAVQATGIGSMMVVHFCDNPITCPADSAQGNAQAKRLFHLEMIARGQYIVQRGMINQSLPMTDKDRDGLVAAIEGFLDDYSELLKGD